MFEFLRGRLSSKKPTQVVLELAGVGYRVHVPVSTFEKLPQAGQEAQLFTYLYVREDALRIYGFASEAERAMFEMLIGVSGIGVGLALTMLSGIPADDLVRAIAEQNASLLQTVKGIGKKTAQRVVLELKEKVAAQPMELQGLKPIASTDAVVALETLNVPRAAAERAVAAAIDQLGPDASVEEIVRTALKLI